VGKHITKILDDLDDVYTIHKPIIYQDKIDGKVVLLCRQVDELAVACSDPSVAQALIDSIGKIVDLKSQGILNSFNGIDTDQRCECVKVSCQCYPAHTHAEGSRLGQSFRPRSKIPSLSSRFLRLHQIESVGPADGSTEHRYRLLAMTVTTSGLEVTESRVDCRR
jgi:hypothetical protein